MAAFVCPRCSTRFPLEAEGNTRCSGCRQVVCLPTKDAPIPAFVEDDEPKRVTFWHGAEEVKWSILFVLGIVVTLSLVAWLRNRGGW